MRSQYSYSARHGQTGAALIVSLIILAVVTILGITSMQSSNTELKLTASMRDRGVAFEAAEAALAIVEENLANDPPLVETLYSTCVGAACFNSTCEGGLCFDGHYELSPTGEYSCKVQEAGKATARVDFWSDASVDVWKNANRHKTLSINSVKTDVKYIVEFLCYIARDESVTFDEINYDNGAPLFRITALAEGNGDRATVALQSTYKVLNGQ